MLTEVLPAVWVSPNADIGARVRFGRNIRIWGGSRVGDDSVIEDHCEIGHPDPITMQQARTALSGSGVLTLDDLDDWCKLPTVVGEGSIIRSGTVIYLGVQAGENFDCGHNVVIRERCVFGRNCYLKVSTDVRRDVVVGHGATLAGSLGDRSHLGDDVTSIGHLVHEYKSGKRGEIQGAPTLARGVFVGRGALVIGGVRLQESCYVGAGAIVARDVPPRALVLGCHGTIHEGRSPLSQHDDLPETDA